MFKNVLIKFLFRTVTRIKHSILRSLFNRLKIYFPKNLYNKYNSGFVKISTPQEKKQKWLMRNQPSTRKQEHDRKTSVLRIVTLTNNNTMTLLSFEGVDNCKRHICALIR